MVRVAINGVAGRMGRCLVEAIGQSSADIQVSVATERADAPALGKDAGTLATGVPIGVAILPELPAGDAPFDVLIDFTVPEATLRCLHYCRQRGKAMVIGTTGFSPSQMQQIEAAAVAVPILVAPNMSVGVNLCLELLERAASALGDTVDVEISEIHHRDKKDAPSGTALKMGAVIARALDRDLAEVAVYGRQGAGLERDRKTIGFASMRAGDIVGEHTVTFAAPGERIEISHKAGSRMNFARGAVRAALWIADRRPGLYSMQDVLKQQGKAG